MRSNDPRQKERNQSTAEDACTRGDPPLDAQALDLLGQALSRPPPAKIPVHSVRSFGYPIGESTCWFVHFCHRDPPPALPAFACPPRRITEPVRPVPRREMETTHHGSNPV